MRYHRAVNEITCRNGRMNHPIYKECTFYEKDGLGLAVVRLQFQEKSKMFWWGDLPMPLPLDILYDEGFVDYFMKHADYPTRDGIYPTVNVRKVMWALRMKPLRKEWWEKYDF